MALKFLLPMIGAEVGENPIVVFLFLYSLFFRNDFLDKYSFQVLWNGTGKHHLSILWCRVLSSFSSNFPPGNRKWNECRSIYCFCGGKTMTLTDSGVFSFFDGTATVRNQNVRQFSLHIYMMLVQPRGDYYRSFVREWNFRCTLYVDYDCPPLVQAPRGKGFPSSKASYSSYRSSCQSPLLQPPNPVGAYNFMKASDQTKVTVGDCSASQKSS